MPEGLKIVVGADTKQAEKAINDLTKTAKTAGTSAATSLSSGFNKATTSTNNLRNSTIGLNRVIQDLPFGFIAISNNLEQLLPAASGLGIAFSGIIAALSFAQLGFQNWTRGAGSASGQAKELSGATDGATTSQERFAKAIESAAAATVQETDKLADLRKVIVDVDTKYNDLTDSIVRQGIAQALFNSKNEIIQKRLADIIASRLEVQKGINAPEFGQEPAKQLDKVEAAARGIPPRLTKAINSVNEFKSSIKEVNDIAKELGISFDSFIKPTKEKVEKLSNVWQVFLFNLRKGLSELASGNDIPTPDKEPFRDQISRLTEGIQKGIIDAAPQIDISGGLSSQFEQNAAIVEDFTKKFQELGAKMPPIDMELPATVNINILNKKLIAAKLGQEVSKVLKQGVIDIGTEVGTAIGESLGTALAGGDLSKVFSGFITTLGSLVEGIGKQIIALGVAALVAKKAFKTLLLHPELAIAAGIGIVAVGAALKASVPKGFAEGGLVSGPTLGLVGEGVGTTRSNPEVIAPLDKLKGLLSGVGGAQLLVARIRGNDILLSNSRTNRTNSRR